MKNTCIIIENKMVQYPAGLIEYYCCPQNFKINCVSLEMLRVF